MLTMRLAAVTTAASAATCCLLCTTHCCHNVAASKATPTASRAYPHGCSSYPPSYYDYDSMQFPPVHRPDLIRQANEFGLIRRLGAGKFSDVFEAVDVLEERRLAEEKKQRRRTHSYYNNNYAPHQLNHHHDHEENAETDTDTSEIDPRTLVVIKCLKPVSDKKVRRELLVLTHASSLPNLARLRGIVVPETKSDGIAKPGTQADPANALRGGADGGNNNTKKKTVHTGVSSRARSAATMPSLILEHAGRQSRWLCHGHGTESKQLESTDVDDEFFYLSDYEIKYYLFHLLIALDALHSRGIMHRDVKPRNTLINRSATLPFNKYPGKLYGSNSQRSVIPGERQSLMLVDLGLADFYLPGQKYNVRVASRHYKAPELLIGNEFYDFSVDLWGVGCILAGLLFRREPFFRGRDNVDQLGKILAVLGPNDLEKYCDRLDIKLSPEVEAAVSKYATRAGPNGTRRPWRDFVAGRPMPEHDAIDLLDRLLVYDHSERYTAREALAHPFFDDVRSRVKEEIRSRDRTVHNYFPHQSP